MSFLKKNIFPSYFISIFTLFLLGVSVYILPQTTFAAITTAGCNTMPNTSIKVISSGGCDTVGPTATETQVGILSDLPGSVCCQKKVACSSPNTCGAQACGVGKLTINGTTCPGICCGPSTSPSCSSQSGTCKGGCLANESAKTASDCIAPNNTCCVVGTTSTSAPTSITFDNPLKFSTVEEVLGSLLGALRGIIVALALIAIVIGAILYITSTGNDSRMTLAKGAITAAMIGLAIGIAAPSFLLQIGDILGWGPVVNSLPPETRTLTAIALSVLQFLLSIVGTLAIIMLVVGGIMYMTAAGNEDRIDTGKKIVMYSLVGIAVALAALVIVTQIAVLFA